MAIEIYSGKDAYIDGVPCVSSWSATQGAAAQRYSASCVAGASNVGPPVLNWSGAASGKGQKPVLFPSGADVVFQGVMNNDAGEGDLLSLDGDIVVEQLTIDINKETSAPISWQATYGFQGTPTQSATGASDSANADAMYGNDLDVKIATTSVGITKVRSAQLVFRRQLTTFVQGGTTYRKAGFLSADINFTLYESSLAIAAYAPGALSRLQIFVSATAYWDFSLARFLGKSNYVVDRESNAILGYTVNAQWNAKNGATPGWISYFDGTTATDYWGDSTP